MKIKPSLRLGIASLLAACALNAAAAPEFSYDMPQNMTSMRTLLATDSIDDNTRSTFNKALNAFVKNSTTVIDVIFSTQQTGTECRIFAIFGNQARDAEEAAVGIIRASNTASKALPPERFTKPVVQRGIAPAGDGFEMLKIENMGGEAGVTLRNYFKAYDDGMLIVSEGPGCEDKPDSINTFLGSLKRD